MAANKQFTWEEIKRTSPVHSARRFAGLIPRPLRGVFAEHNKANDCWIVIDNRVYDMSAFLADHPGGKAVLVKVGGTDATKQYATPFAALRRAPLRVCRFFR